MPDVSAVRFCDQCGSALPAGAHFCGVCGAPAPALGVGGQTRTGRRPIWDLAATGAALLAGLTSVFLPWRSDEAGLALTAGRITLGLGLLVTAATVVSWLRPVHSASSIWLQIGVGVAWLVAGGDLLLRAEVQSQVGVFLLVASGVVIAASGALSLGLPRPGGVPTPEEPTVQSFEETDEVFPGEAAQPTGTREQGTVIVEPSEDEAAEATEESEVEQKSSIPKRKTGARKSGARKKSGAKKKPSAKGAQRKRSS